MPALPTLRPRADHGASRVVNQLGLTTGPFWSQVDDDPHAPDTTDFIRNVGGDDAHCNFLISAMPSDFGSMDTLEIALHGTTGIIVDDTISLYAQVFEFDNTTTLTTEVLVGTHLTFAGGALSTIAWSAADVVDGDKAKWDGASLRLRWDYTASGVTDLAVLQANAVELNGTYAYATVTGARATETDTANAGVATTSVVGDRATETAIAFAGTLVASVAGSRAVEVDHASAGVVLVKGADDDYPIPDANRRKRQSRQVQWMFEHGLLTPPYRVNA